MCAMLTTYSKDDNMTLYAVEQLLEGPAKTTSFRGFDYSWQEHIPIPSICSFFCNPRTKLGN